MFYKTYKLNNKNMKNYDALTEDRKENIDLFKHMIEPEQYSYYSHQLNKVFSKNSYFKFFNDLSKVEEKKQIIFKDKIQQWLNLSNYSTNIGSENFNIKKFKSKLKEMEAKEIEKRKKNNDKRTIKRKLLSQLTANKILEIKNKSKFNNPCIGVYNPIYESIGKHTYRVTFGKNFDDFNNENKNKKSNSENKNKSFSIKSKTIDKNLKYNKKILNFQKKANKTQTQIRMRHINKNNLFSENNFFQNIILNKTIMKNLSQEYRNKTKNKLNLRKIMLNDDLLFFPKIKRKKRNKNINENLNNICNSFKDTKSNQNTFNKNIYLTFKDSSSNRKIKGNVNFDKISTNKKVGSYFEEIAKKNKSPPVGIYHPIYTSIFERTTNIIFPCNKNNKNGKKKYIHKVITNYNQNGDYELFNILNNKGVNKD